MENSGNYVEMREMGRQNTGGSSNGEFGELWRNRGNGPAEHAGVGKWGIRGIMKKSGKWAGRPRGGREMGNSENHKEIGEMGWSTMGSREMWNSGNYEEIGELGWAAQHRGVGKWGIRGIMKKSGNGLGGSVQGVIEWRIRRIMKKSVKWAGRLSTGGQEMENSESYGEIGEME